MYSTNTTAIDVLHSNNHCFHPVGSVNHALTVYLCLYRHRSANMIQPVAMVSCDYAHVQAVVTLECLYNSSFYVGAL